MDLFVREADFRSRRLITFRLGRFTVTGNIAPLLRGVIARISAADVIQWN
jgi:hypothetical protein